MGDEQKGEECGRNGKDCWRKIKGNDLHSNTVLENPYKMESKENKEPD